MSFRKFTRFNQVAIVALCLGLAGCAATPQHAVNSNEIVIGVAGPMTGDLADLGEQLRVGTKLAVRDLNSSGGLLGKKIRLVIGDDQCDPSQAVQVANNMISQGTSLVVGHYCSGSSMPASKIYAAGHVLQITPASTSPRLTDDAAARGITTLFRLAGRDDQQGVFAADWLIQKRPTSKLAVISDGSAYGDLLVGPLIAELTANHMTPALTTSYIPKSANFNKLIQSLQQSHADIVFIGGYYDDVGLIIQQARNAGSKAEFVGADTLDHPDFASVAGSAANGVRFSDAAPVTDAPNARKIVAEIRSSGSEPGGYMLSSYAAVQAWAAGVARANSIDVLEVAAAMRSGTVDSVVGPLEWDYKGDLKRGSYAWFIWHGSTYSQE
jgi:branched-chain amino acid transport system substrate-binding protein